jgi:apolipoprotein N-acyltransferase
VETLNLAVLSGLLLALSFPNAFFRDLNWSQGAFGMLSLLPLLLALDQKGLQLKRAFKLGYASGITFFLLGTYWINHIGPMGLGAAPAWLGLSAYLALYLGAFAWALTWGRQRGLKGEALWIPALWTLLEFLRERLLTGYPWMSLGSSQCLDAALLPMASVTGVYGLHFAVALANVILWKFWKGEKKTYEWGAASLALGLVLSLRLAALPRPEAPEKIKVAVLQGNVNEDQAWTPQYRRGVMAIYSGMMQAALKQGAKVMIWPESAFPGIFSQPSPEREALLTFAKREKVSLIFGSTLLDPAKNSFSNAAVFVDSKGNADAYAKRQLVPFGEFIPLRDEIPLLDQVLNQAGLENFAAGIGPAIFQDDHFKAAPLVCYESIYGSLAATEPDGFLSVITLDTWFGDSLAPRHHLSQSILRAVEGQRWVARAAATGISAFINPQGEIVSQLRLNSAGFLVQEIDSQCSRTFYLLHGAWFVGLCAGLCMLVLAFSPMKGFKKDHR